MENSTNAGRKLILSLWAQKVARVVSQGAVVA